MKLNTLSAAGSNNSFFSCDFCGQQEKGRGYLQRHIDSKHRKFHCNVCDQVYSQKKNILDHLRTHFERFICQYCGLEILNRRKFQKHVYQKHEPKNKQLILSIQSRETYDCRHCIRTFPTAVHRNCHENIVHKGRSEEAFKCPECLLVFVTKDDLRSHSFEHYTGALFFCAHPDCDRFFKAKKQLANHLFIHGPAIHECVKCLKRFSQSANLSKHKKRCKGRSAVNLVEEDQEEVVKAAKEQFLQLGGKLKVKTKPVAASNIEVKSEPVDIEPEFDNKASLQFVEYLEEFSNEVNLPDFQEVQDSGARKDEQMLDKTRLSIELQDLSSDLIVTRARSSKILTQDVCSLQTSSVNRPTAHRLEKALESKKQIRLSQNKTLVAKDIEKSCDNCEFTSRSRKQMCKHVQQHKKLRNMKPPRNSTSRYEGEGEGERPFLCNLCQSSFKCSSTLKNHLKTHEDPSECPICHKFLPNMERHLKWHQRPKSDPYQCPQCGKLCSTKQMVQEHIRRVHEKMPLGKTYTCGVCDLNFIRNSDLRRHSFIHYRGRIYNCNISGCHEMFKTAFKLQVHMSVHDPHKEATFGCEFCEKKYLRKTALSKHQKQIHGDLVAKMRSKTTNNIE